MLTLKKLISLSKSCCCFFSCSFIFVSSRIFHASAAEANLSTLNSLLEGSLHIPAFPSSNSSSTQYPNVSSVEIDDMMNLPRITSGSDSSLPLGMTTARYLLEASLSTEVAAKSDATAKTTGSVVILGKFVSEGDNIGDGLDLALRVLNGFILAGKTEALSVKSLVHPESWSRRYGGGIRDTIMFD